MFITTPIVRYVIATLHKKGVLNPEHKDALHRYDLYFNLAVTGVAALVATAYLAG